MLFRRLFVAFILSTLCTILCAATASAQGVAPSAPATIRVPFTVVQGGPAVSKDQLTAVLDKQPVGIQNVVSAKDEPLVYAVLLDISGSSSDQQLFERQSTFKLFRGLAVGQNTGFFGYFNDEVYLSNKPPSLQEVFKELKDMGRFLGGSAVYDAVLKAVDLVSKQTEGTNSRRAVFVITDGDDNASHITLKQLIQRAQREGVTVFCICLTRNPKNREFNKGTITKMSDETGGVPHVFAPPDDFVPSVLSEIENQSWLVLSPEVAKTGKMYPLEVKTDETLRISAPHAVFVP